ncbi:carbohydrate esterase family 4 protein [Amylocarpus encephaloides]|uniref:Carbohydrate esterase family 4 protein n=1 Tax=Amylocarpus encephaloides TaxID=45428 RepID=A0A9P7YRP3_9HELO|nr:carbohydrate esterase family 4 protein [Amylocarpus encephaloides]
MKLTIASVTALTVSWANIAQAVCSSNLVIDNYSNFANHLNTLGQYTSDDGTTTNLKADVANKKITFTGGTSSYFYSTTACQAATTDKYTSIKFPVKGPSGSSFTFELQTSTSCSTTAYTSYYKQITGMTGASQIVIVPLSDFTGANLNAIRSIVLGSFSVSGAWEIGQTEMVCSAGGTPTTVSSSTTKPTVSTTVPAPTGACTSQLIDDFASQSRLTFLFYNAQLLPSSDDATMAAVSGRADTETSVIVADNHLTLTPANTNSYWYTQLGCTKATNIYGGIGLNIKAAAGTTLIVELQTSAACNTNAPTFIGVSSTSLGWVFDGTEKFYTIPFSKFAGLDTDHLVALLFAGISKPVTFGPIAFYCGNTGAAYPVPSTIAVVQPSATIPATTGASAVVIDTFKNTGSNDLGFYHGGDDAALFAQTSGKLTVNTKGNSDISWYTQISGGCTDVTPNENSYLHIAYTGSNAFSIAMQQHNPTCNPDINPYPYTWDSVEASRYSDGGKTNIYVPLKHFNIDRKKSIGFALKGFFTSSTTTITRIEIVNTVPNGFLVPSKLSTAPLVFACTRPNSFAFAIDDGSPEYAQRVVSAIDAAGIKVTFFTVGAPLLDASTNLTNVYKAMINRGHQIAYHSYTHPPLEGLPSLAAIDWEIQEDIKAVSKTLGITSTYFRPPFGTEGARIRQRLAALIPGVKFVAWSVDVQDYLWASTNTPEKQLTNFQADVNKGGNLVVMHYLYESTVSYLPQLIEIARKTGKQLMRVDQCMEDPNAPPL